MKKFLMLLIFIVLVFSTTGCGSSGGGGTLTSEQVTQIEAASQNISNVIQQAENPTSTEALQAAKTEAASQAAVQAAEVIDGQLVVQYKDAGQEIWVTQTPQFTPPADLEELRALTRRIISQTKTGRTPVGTRNAVLINALHDDPGCNNLIETFQAMHDILVAKGFNVTDLTGASASPDNLKGLSGDSVIVIMGHGGTGETILLPTYPYAVQTGKEWDRSFTSSPDWLMNRLVFMHLPWGTGDKNERARHMKYLVGITGRFWADKYAGSHFNNALFMNLACKSSKYQAFRDDLFGVGVTAYTGWSEDQGISPYAAWRMLALMAGEKTLQQAYDELPNSYKHQDRSDENHSWEADLWIGKDDGLNITLGGPVIQGSQISITSPANGLTTTQRTCVVQGKITPWTSGLFIATISVNGESNALDVDDSGNFSHTVSLRAGENIIRVSSITTAESSSEIRVTGSFSSDVFWSQLSWNTDLNDIDLHMVPVEGAGGATDECYYAHKVSFWGAQLDVDDVNGYGPEHITASSILAGKYKLYVHYYDSHLQTQSPVVSVAVSANGGETKIFTLPAMSFHDRWDVCYISYPAGTIETINQYIPAGQGMGNLFPSKDK